MPPLARRYLKTAVAFTILSVLTGMHMSSAIHIGSGVMHRWYVSAHTHLVLVGGMALAVCGVALWKLPPAPRERPRLDGALYGLLVLSTLVRFAGECTLGYLAPEPAWLHWTVHVAATAQGLALVVFLLRLWPRLR